MRLGVTRAAEQLSALSSRASLEGIELVPLPFTRSEPLPFELPSAVPFDKIDWLFFTSANGVRFFFAWLVQLGLIPAPVDCLPHVLPSSKSGDPGVKTRQNYVPADHCPAFPAPHL